MHKTGSVAGPEAAQDAQNRVGCWTRDGSGCTKPGRLLDQRRFRMHKTGSVAGPEAVQDAQK